MKPRERASLIQHSRNNRFDMRLVLSIVLAIAVLFGQSFPAMAGHGSDTSANMIEICGDGGSYFIEIGEDGQKQAPECTHCDYCLTPVGDTQAVHSTQPNELALTYFSNISYSTDPATLPDNPEQYWSACRGPPIASIEKIMTTNTSLTIKEPIGSESTAWSIPCA
jgi:hypothetical protein